MISCTLICGFTLSNAMLIIFAFFWVTLIVLPSSSFTSLPVLKSSAPLSCTWRFWSGSFARGPIFLTLSLCWIKSLTFCVISLSGSKSVNLSAPIACANFLLGVDDPFAKFTILFIASLKSLALFAMSLILLFAAGLFAPKSWNARASYARTYPYIFW